MKKIGNYHDFYFKNDAFILVDISWLKLLKNVF